MAKEKFDRSKPHVNIGTIGISDEDIRWQSELLELMRMSREREERPKPQDHPNFVNKGKKGLRCNRTACEEEDAYYWNRVTEAYYCQGCARGINSSALQSGMPPLCEMSYKDSELWELKKKERRKKSSLRGISPDFAILDDPWMTDGQRRAAKKIKKQKIHSIVFSNEELNHLGSLNGKAKKKYVKELREKYGEPI